MLALILIFIFYELHVRHELIWELNFVFFYFQIKNLLDKVFKKCGIYCMVFLFISFLLENKE